MCGVPSVLPRAALVLWRGVVGALGTPGPRLIIICPNHHQMTRNSC
jgi:hypothetical protein